MSSSFIRKPKYILYAAAAIVVLVTGGIVTATLIVGQARPTYESLSVLYATSYNDAPDKIFLKVNDYNVNYREYAEIKAKATVGLANHKTQIQQAISLADWTPPEGAERDEPLRPLPQFMMTAQFKDMVAVLDKHGPDVSALAALIFRYAQYSTAVEQGFAVDEAALATEVAGTRRIYEQNVAVTQGGQYGEFKGYIDVLGADVYWGEFFPRELRMIMTINAWRNSALQAGLEENEYDEKKTKQIRLMLADEVLGKVRVQVIDDSDLKAASAQAMTYSREYNAVMLAPSY